MRHAAAFFRVEGSSGAGKLESPPVGSLSVSWLLLSRPHHSDTDSESREALEIILHGSGGGGDFFSLADWCSDNRLFEWDFSMFLICFASLNL